MCFQGGARPGGAGGSSGGQGGMFGFGQTTAKVVTDDVGVRFKLVECLCIYADIIINF